MRKGMRKKEHMKVVKIIRNFNERLAADDYLGLNRFRIDLFSEKSFMYSDGSGVYLNLHFKLTDNWTGNTAFFYCSNYDCVISIYEYANDFLIRCSSGMSGCVPSLHYTAYDVHEIKPYAKGRITSKDKYDEGIVNTYNYTKYNLFEREE